jgi:hypothetical protein
MTKTAKCDRTKEDIKLANGFFVANPKTGEWYFLGPNAQESQDDYSVAVVELLSGPEKFVDWMAHLNEKTWFQPDKFFDFFDRLRSENDLYGAL